MQSKARERMMNSIKALLSDGATVDEAVVIQQRPGWALPATLVAGLVVAVVVNLIGVGTIVAGALIGGTVGFVYVLATDNLILAKTSEGTVVAEAAKRNMEAVGITARLDDATTIDRTTGLLNDTVTIDGEKYITSRAFRDRLTSITGVAA